MILDDLERIIASRRTDPPEGSYVASLLASGKDRILKKIAEEAAEVIIASKSEGRQRTISELADLWFHCMVLMSVDGIRHEDVFRELETRKAGYKGENNA